MNSQPKSVALKIALEQFIYAYKDFGVFNKNYLFNIFKPIYNEKGTQHYSIIYGDVNKLNDLNNRLGRNIGDIALSNLVRIMKDCLPNNSSFFRLAGDEFAIILYDSDSSAVNKCINDINHSLDDIHNKPYTYGLTITLVSSDNLPETDFDNLFSLLDRKISAKKLQYKSATTASWIDVKANINKCVRNYINNFRLNDNTTITNTFSEEYIKQLIDDLFDDKSNQNHQESSNVETHPLNNEDDYNSSPPLFDKKEAILIHSFLTDQISPSELTKKDEQNLRALFNNSIRNFNTGLFSKDYFYKILKPKFQTTQYTDKKDCHIIYVHTTGLKISNTLNGHDKTDDELRRLANIIENSFRLSSKIPITFNQKSLSFNSIDNFIFDFKAGNFVAILTSLPDNFDVEELTEYINCRFNNQCMKVSSFHKVVHYNEDIEKAIKKAHQGAKKAKKHPINYLDSETQKALFRTHLHNLIDFYWNNIDSPDCQYNKDKFSSLFIETYKQCLEQSLASPIEH